MRISATDIDDGNNSVVVYSLSPKKEDDGPYFRIDTRTGVIYLAKKLDVSNQQRNFIKKKNNKNFWKFNSTWNSLTEKS